MELTRSNYQTEKASLEESIRNCDFLAVDFEFSGLARQGTEILAFDSPEKVYALSCQNVSEYLVIQIGLAAFTFDSEKNRFTYAAYTIPIFPRPSQLESRMAERRQGASFLCQASSLWFLSSHGFDFNKWIKEGLNYMHAEDEAKMRAELIKRHEWRLKNVLASRESGKGRSSLAVPDELKPLLNKYVKQIGEFIADESVSELVLSLQNREIRKYFFDCLHATFSTKIFNETRKDQNGDLEVVIERCQSEAEFKTKFNRVLERELAQLDDVAGIASLFRLISESNKLVIGHNMLLDLLHATKSFCAPLPSDYEEFKRSIPKFFPRLMDTKVLAAQAPLKELINDMNSLNEIFRRVMNKPFVPVIVDPCSEEFAFASEKQHDAGYDAFLTGTIFVNLANHYGNSKDPSRSSVAVPFELLRPFENKIHCPRVNDVSFLNLAGPDTLPDRRHVFHLELTGESNWSNSDVVSLFSAFGPVKLYWNNDSSLFVELLKRNEAAIVLTHMKQNNKLYKVTPASEFLALRSTSSSPPKSSASSVASNGSSASHYRAFAFHKSAGGGSLKHQASAEADGNASDEQSETKALKKLRVKDQSHSAVSSTSDDEPVVALCDGIKRSPQKETFPVPTDWY